MIQTFNTDQMAEIFGYHSRRSFTNELSRNPWKFPPPVRIPGKRRLIWLRDVVLAWLLQHCEGPGTRR
ncbi:MAG: helix-turn-helix transcriptional regulator [Acidobacteriaceae bacterium]